MKKILILLLVLVVLGAGYFGAVSQKKDMLHEGQIVYSGEPVVFQSSEGQFSVQYGQGGDVAQIVKNGIVYDLLRAPAASGAKYVNADESVVFWEHDNKATLEIDGVVLLKDAVEANVLTFSIAPEKVACVGVGPMECLVVNDEYFYDTIQGFDFESGYQYVILVSRTEQEDAPADASTYQYSLVELVSKTQATDSVVNLAGTKWQWQQTLTAEDLAITPTKPEAFTMTFMKDGSFSVTTDCNGGGGTYVQGENSLTFGQIAVTEMACEGPTQEAEFYEILSVVQRYLMTSYGNLVLSSSAGEMLFFPVGG